MERQAQELTPQDYLNKVKDAYQIKQNLEINFIQKESKIEKTITVEDLIKNKKNALYFKSCRDCKYKIAHNVEFVKILIEDCHNCEISLHGPIKTNVLEVWRNNNLVLTVDTEVHTLQADLCEGLNITYTHKGFLGSLVQAGIKDLSVQFEDYPELNFKSGVHVLRDEYPDLDDRLDQFITRFVKDLENKLTTEKIIRLDNGFHTTEREKHEWDAQKEKNDKNTEDAVRKMLKLAGPTIGLTEESVSAKSKEGKAEQASKLKREQQSNLKKQQGNNAFSAKNFPLAITHYSEAIDIYPENILLWSNRAMAYYESEQYDLALADANKCIEIDQDFVKGHFRKGMILFKQGKNAEAVAALTQAHDLSPKEEEIKQWLQNAKQAAGAV